MEDALNNNPLYFQCGVHYFKTISDIKSSRKISSIDHSHTYICIMRKKTNKQYKEYRKEKHFSDSNHNTKYNFHFSTSITHPSAEK